MRTGDYNHSFWCAVCCGHPQLLCCRGIAHVCWNWVSENVTWYEVHHYKHSHYTYCYIHQEGVALQYWVDAHHCQLVACILFKYYYYNYYLYYFGQHVDPL